MKRIVAVIVSVVILLTTLVVSVSAANNSNKIVKKDNKWICADKDGKFVSGANGIYKNDNGWWKTTNGVVTFKETGIFKNEYGWWRVENSKVNFKANGIYKNQYGWWKTTNGKVTFKENGVFKNKYGWWRVVNSKVVFNANSIYKNAYGWWKTTNGKVTFDETGVFKNDYGSWYVKDSKVDFTKNGKVTINGITYNIVDGKADMTNIDSAVVTFNANAEDVTNLPQPVTVNLNEQVLEPASPQKEGYYFVGWFLDAAGSVKYNFEMPVTDNLVLYAIWRNNSDNLNDDIIDRGDIEILSNDGQIDVVYNQKGDIIAVEGKLTNAKILDKNDASEVLNSAQSLFGESFNASEDEITVLKTDTEMNQEEAFYRFTPTVDDVPVLGSQIIISTDNNGEVTGLFNSYDSKIENVSIDAQITEQEAEDYALKYLIDDEIINSFLNITATKNNVDLEIVKQEFKNCVSCESKLLVFAPGNNKNPALVYAVTTTCALTLDEGVEDISNYLDVNRTYYIRADSSDGDLYMMIDNQEGLSFSDKDLKGNDRVLEVTKNGAHYELRDGLRHLETYKAKQKGVLFWKSYELPGEIATSKNILFNETFEKSAVSAHANMRNVYDYYNYTLHRNSFDDKGATIKVSYNFGSLYKNAQWDSVRQLFEFGTPGEFEAALDVVGHEFTHAVINYIVGDGYTVSLTYQGESGALNESYADIMGALIEGKTGKDFGLIGEDKSWISRNMAKPSDYEQPEHYASRYLGASDNGGVHSNSGIFNYAAYKMMNDSRTNGISKSTWASVFYKSIYRLTTTATFLDGRNAVLFSARNHSFNHDELQAIKDAFDSVGIIEPNAIRMVLTWGETPTDLDSHLVGFDNSGSKLFHVYYSDPLADGGEENQLLADLDYDDTTSYGPEVTTLHGMNPGTYYFTVHDYSNGSSSDSKYMANSDATVKIYIGNNRLPDKVFKVDKNSSGTYWDVFKLVIYDSVSYDIFPINQYGATSSYA